MEDVLTKPDQQPSKNQPEINKENDGGRCQRDERLFDSSQHIHQV